MFTFGLDSHSSRCPTFFFFENVDKQMSDIYTKFYDFRPRGKPMVAIRMNLGLKNSKWTYPLIAAGPSIRKCFEIQKKKKRSIKLMEEKGSERAFPNQRRLHQGWFCFK